MAKPITKEGYDNVKVKISELKTEFESLPEVIAEAREKGDLKENPAIIHSLSDNN